MYASILFTRWVIIFNQNNQFNKRSFKFFLCRQTKQRLQIKRLTQIAAPNKRRMMQWYWTRSFQIKTHAWRISGFGTPLQTCLGVIIAAKVKWVFGWPEYSPPENSQFSLRWGVYLEPGILPSHQLLWFLASIYLDLGFEPLISQRWGSKFHPLVHHVSTWFLNNDTLNKSKKK